MKTSTFLAALREHAALPLIFRAPGSGGIAPQYHLTEVKRVSYETMDCGAITHRWAESHFELWVPAAPEAGRAHMAAGKFLKIVDRVQAELPLAGEVPARILAAFGGGAAALYDVGAVRAAEGKLWVELVPDRTRCKAAERRSATQAGGCCGTLEATSDQPAEEKVEAGCGCAPQGSAQPVAACCA